MPATSIHLLTSGDTQYDLRQAVMWVLEDATTVRVNYRGAPEGTWIRHDRVAWLAAKETSLGGLISSSPHIFNTGTSYFDIRFAAAWAPGNGTEVRVYYENVNENSWVTHPVMAAWEAKKQVSMDAETQGWGRVIPDAAVVTGTSNNAVATAQLLSQAITGNSFQTIAAATTALYQFDKPATKTDTVVVFEFSGGVATDFVILLQKFNGVTWDTVVTWVTWTPAAMSIGNKADMILLEAGTHDAAGTYRLSVQNVTAAARSMRTPHIYAWPLAGVPPVVHVVGASIMEGDTRWDRWIAQCAPLGIDVLCVNFGAGGMECQGIGDNVARWHSVPWRPDMQWVVQHAGGNNVTPTRPYSGLSPAQIADIQGRLDYLMAQYPNPGLALPACITFRDYGAPNPVMDAVYENRGSLPYNDAIWIPTIASDFPHAMNVDGRPIMDFYSLVLNNEEAWLGDGVHMNGTGQAAFDNWICDRWLRYTRGQELPVVPITNPYPAATALVIIAESIPNQANFTIAHDAVIALPARNSGGRTELLNRLAVLGFPTCTVLPVVTGLAIQGSTIYGGPGTWSNGPLTYQYAWLRDGVEIPGAISDAYEITPEDANRYLSRRVIATNALGTGTAYSLTTLVGAVSAPNTIPSLKVWLDASDASTFSYSSGNVVSEWRDKSGNGYHATQGTVANQPLRQVAADGITEVKADGSNDFMSIPSMPVIQPRTAPADVFVLSGLNVDLVGALLALSAPDGINRHLYSFLWEDGSNPFLNTNFGGIVTGTTKAQILAGYPAFDQTKPILVEMASPVGDTGTARIDNVFSRSASIGTMDLTGATWTLFCRNPAPGFVGAGPLRQVVIFDRVLTDQERTGVSNWFRLTHVVPLPVRVALPGIVGVVSNGFTVTGTDGTWTGATSYMRQWLRDGVPIAGATTNTYAVTAADNGTTLSFRVIGVNSSGAVTAVSPGAVVVPALAPNEISDLRLWLDANDAASFSYGTAPAVAQWNDRSGNNYHATQATPANQPARRQNPVDGVWEVFADGVNDWMGIAALPLVVPQTDPCEQFILTGASPDLVGALMGLTTNPGAGFRHMYVYLYDDGTNTLFNVFVGGTNSNYSEAGIKTSYPSFDKTIPHCWNIASPPGPTCTVRIDNIFERTAAQTGSTVVAGSTWTLFCRNAPPSFAGQGPLRQVVQYGRVLTAPERAALHEWLWRRYVPQAYAPVNTVLPSFTGTVSNGFTVTASDGTWTGIPVLTRRWLRDGIPIAGATAATYAVTAADNGTTLSLEVTATNSVGSTVAVSLGTSVVPSLAPTEIANLMMWLDADDASTFTYGTAPAVAEWRDKSGNGYHATQGSVPNQPTRRQSPTDNGWEVVANGTSGYMRIPTLPIIPPQTQTADLFVLTGDNPDTNGGAYVGQTTTATGTYRHLYMYTWEDGTNPQYNFNMGGTVNGRTRAQATAAGFTPDYTKPWLWEIAAPIGTSATGRINNTFEITCSVGANDMTASSWVLFGRNVAPAFQSTGPLRHVVLFSRVLNTAERSALAQWFRLHGGLP